MIRLREKDIKRLANVTEVSEADLMKLVAMNLIAHGYAVDRLIQYSYKKLKRTKRYTPKQMVEALMREYSVSRSKVYNAIYGKKAKTYYCNECMRKIPVSEYKRNNGLCDHCVSENIVIDV